jgi:DNA replication protein DnaC
MVTNATEPTAIIKTRKYCLAQESLQLMMEEVGKRYAQCTFDSFVADDAEKRTVVTKIRAYMRSSKIESGRGLLLTGPKGTGKDHLLVSAAKEYVPLHDHTVSWRNGLELLTHLVDFDFGRLDWCPYMKNCYNHDVLYISDPLPPTGELNQAQQTAFIKLIDYRYRNCLATWLTMNVCSSEEMDARMGPVIADRLRDGATLIECNWESYRKLSQ